MLIVIYSIPFKLAAPKSTLAYVVSCSAVVALLPSTRLLARRPRMRRRRSARAATSFSMLSMSGLLYHARTERTGVVFGNERAALM